MANPMTTYGTIAVGSGLKDPDEGELMYTSSNGKSFPIGKMFERIEKLEERLAMIENADPEQLEKHKMLREAYTKYKFIEGLIGKEDDDNG